MSTGAFKPPPTAQEAVLSELRREIATGQLVPGSALPQAAIADRLGVSRVPVREALKILEGEGHVSYAPRRGYTVTTLDVGELLEIYEIRALLERDAIFRGEESMGSDMADYLDELIDSMDDCIAGGDIGQLAVVNREFHFSILSLSERHHLMRLIQNLWDASEPYRARYFGDSANCARVQSEHRAISEAVRRRDPQSVVDLHDQHRVVAARTVVEILEGSEA